ncbi:hypothetical protein QYF61_012003 [Mycteria americana]|uniref:Uncharacterized protein n=1 Tax=Mycteria americana TaxID=33587 RepID=A0AAN7NFD7_MYCAM|nr:hypothetical protein QYF61_012003 [Mycteria americana]
MANPAKWERLRPLRPDTLRVSEVQGGRGREVPLGDGERAGRRCNALLPRREVLRRFPKVLPLACPAGGSLGWEDEAGLARVVHERGVVVEISYSLVSLTSVPWKIMKEVLLEAISRHVKEKVIGNSQHDYTCKLITFDCKLLDECVKNKKNQNNKKNPKKTPNWLDHQAQRGVWITSGVPQESILGHVLLIGGGCGMHPHDVYGWGRCHRQLGIGWRNGSGTGWGTTWLKGPGDPDGQCTKHVPTLCPGIEAYEAVLAGA